MALTLTRTTDDPPISAPRRPATTGVLHLGLGAFHRAHQAFYFDRLLRNGNVDWGVASVNLRSPVIVEAMQVQGNAYVRWERGRDAEEFRTIGAVTGSYHLPSSRDTVRDLFCDPRIRMLTITVSEKGYHFDPAAEDIDVGDPDIQADLSTPHLPTTLPAVLAWGLDARRQSGAGPITVVSCDNYRRNGHVVKSVAEGFSRRCYPDLTEWLDEAVTFPSSMVDTIVPKVTSDDIAEFARRTGKTDRAMVICEDYIRWVIEDDFAGKRPPLDTVGVEFVASIDPYETNKLLLLNAPHSALAYLGHSAGFEYVHEAVKVPLLNRCLGQLLSEALLPVARDIAGTSPIDYGARTLNRFANPNIAYRTRQVATDGSLKLQQRVLPALTWHLSRGQVPDGLSLVLAAWMRFLSGKTDRGEAYEISDPMTDAITERLERAVGYDDAVAKLLSIRAIFPEHIAQNEELTARITRHFIGLTEMGTLRWLRSEEAQENWKTA